MHRDPRPRGTSETLNDSGPLSTDALRTDSGRRASAGLSVDRWLSVRHSDDCAVHNRVVSRSDGRRRSR